MTTMMHANIILTYENKRQAIGGARERKKEWAPVDFLMRYLVKRLFTHLYITKYNTFQHLMRHRRVAAAKE